MSLPCVLRSSRRALTALLVTVVTVTGLAATPGTATAATPARATSAYTTTYYETGVQHWVNQVRRRHGLRPLRLASCTDAVAERWSAHLAATGSFVHQSMSTLLSRCHARYAGETLGRGAVTPRRLVSMWMHSAPHRAVLMSRSPRRIGIGATPTASGAWVVAANFMRF